MTAADRGRNPSHDGGTVSTGLDAYAISVLWERGWRGGPGSRVGGAVVERYRYCADPCRERRLRRARDAANPEHAEADLVGDNNDEAGPSNAAMGAEEPCGRQQR